jgi:hypothetical protein
MLILLLLPLSVCRIRPTGRKTVALVRGLWILSGLAALLMPATAAAQWSADPRLQQSMRTQQPMRAPVYYVAQRNEFAQHNEAAPRQVAQRTVATPVSSVSPTPLPKPTASCTFCNGIRPQDEILLVNVRTVGCSTDPNRMAEGVCLQTYRVVDDSGRRRWQSYDLESLRAADPSVTTVVFVHGNQISSGEACQGGLTIYRRLVRCHCSAQPIRYVIFSWPASKVSGPLKDVRIKAARTRPVGWELAWFLDQLPGETPLGLIGYSYGARIITGGLHILGGGDLCGLGLEERMNPDRAPANVVLIAAALNSNWLGPNQYHGQAMSQVDHMLCLNNCEDMAMRYYYLSTKCGRPQALGLCGPTYLSPEDRAKIRNRDLSSYDGRRHDLMRYTCAPGAIEQAWDYTTFEQ